MNSVGWSYTFASSFTVASQNAFLLKKKYSQIVQNPVAAGFMERSPKGNTPMYP